MVHSFFEIPTGGGVIVMNIITSEPCGGRFHGRDRIFYGTKTKKSGNMFISNEIFVITWHQMGWEIKRKKKKTKTGKSESAIIISRVSIAIVFNLMQTSQSGVYSHER